MIEEREDMPDLFEMNPSSTSGGDSGGEEGGPESAPEWNHEVIMEEILEIFKLYGMDRLTSLGVLEVTKYHLVFESVEASCQEARTQQSRAG
mgnify:CR=1 FL=1